MSNALNLLLLLGPWTVTALVLAGGIFIVVVGAQVPQMLVHASVACYAALMLNTDLVPIPGVVDLRVLAVGLAAYLVVVRGRWPRPWMLARGAFPAALAFYGIGFFTIGTAVDRSAAGDALFAGILCVGFVWMLVAAAEPDEIRSAIHGVSGLILLGSIVIVFVDPAGAKIHGRWSGLVTNANTLGMFSAMFLMSARPSRAARSLPATIIGLIGSASRSSAFAAGLIAGPRLVEGMGRRVRRLVMVVAILAAIPVIHAVFFSAGDATGMDSGVHGGTLTRTGNSRADYWSDGWHQFATHPATGLGLGNEPHLLSSSVLSPIVQVGIAGAIPLGLVVALAIRRSRGQPTIFRSMLGFLLVHGIFEMWIFAGGSVIFAFFLIAAFDPELQRTIVDEAAEDDDEEMEWNITTANARRVGPKIA